MTRWGPWLKATVVVLELAGWRSASAQQVSVHMSSGVAVAADVLERTKTDVVQLYASIGVNISWTDDFRAKPYPIVVKIVREDTTRHLKVRSSALGVALRSDKTRMGTIAYVFFDRVDDAAAKRRLDTARVLGAAVAHELGHLMLPYGQHSNAGLMRDGWDEANFRSAGGGLLQFTKEQGQEIRQGLAARTRSSQR